MAVAFPLGIPTKHRRLRRGFRWRCETLEARVLLAVAPVALRDAYELTAGDVLAVTAAGGVLANDQALDGGTLQAVLVDPPAHGQVTLAADGSLTYQTVANFGGQDRLTYRAVSGDQSSDATSVTFNVIQLPNVPFAAEDHFRLAEDGQLDVGHGWGVSHRVVNIVAREFVYDPQGQWLFALVDDDLVPIDAATGRVGTARPLGGSAERIVISDDGHYIFAVTDQGHTVRRFNTHNMTVDLQWNVSDGSELSPAIADIETVPGRPSAVAIALYYPCCFPPMGGVVVFDDGIPLPKTTIAGVGLSPGGDNIAFVGDSTLIGFSHTDNSFSLTSMRVDQTGVQIENSGITGMGDFHGTILAGGGFVYSSDGRVIRLSDGAFVGGLPPMWVILPDAKHDRVYAIEGHPGGSKSISWYAPDTLTFLGSVPLPNLDVTHLSLIQSGKNRMAYRAIDGRVVIVESDAFDPPDDFRDGVLWNDQDPEQQPLTALLVQGTQHGALSWNGDGTFAYQPDRDFHGDDSFSYQVSDGAHLSNVTTVSLTIDAVNDPPTAAPDRFVLSVAGALSIPASNGLLANDSDVDENDPLIAILDTPPAHGSLSLNADGSFVYTPDAGFSLSDQFTYRASDGVNDSEPTTVAFWLDAPTIVVGQHELRANQAGQQIPIFVTGGQPVSGLDLYVQVGDGGPELTQLGLPAGTTGPAISGADLKSNTIFQSIADSSIDLGSLPQLATWSISLAAGGTVAADGLLATLTVDTTGLFSGQWDVSIANVLAAHPLGPFQTSFATTPAHLVNGTFTVLPGTVVGRHVFYNNSSWDDRDPAANEADDAAIAADKAVLLPGQTATFRNYTSYSRGLNGVMIDMLGAADIESLTLDDFEFRVGVSNNLTTWVTAPAPVMSVRAGAGVSGADRISFTWPDQAILKTWMQVRVKSNVRTLLAADDVFYFGNAVGETGNAAGQTLVTSIDVIQTRDHQRGPFELASIDDRFDFNRDRLVSSIDVILARDNQTGPITALPLIAPPATTPVQAVAASARDVDHVIGDFNGDGRFDSSDLVELFRLGLHDMPVPVHDGTSTDADWNGDGVFDSADLVMLLQFAGDGYERRR